MKNKFQANCFLPGSWNHFSIRAIYIPHGSYSLMRGEKCLSMPLVHVQLILKVRKWGANSLLHHFNHYHQVISLQHREAIDQETQRAHTPPGFCISHRTPRTPPFHCYFLYQWKLCFLSLPLPGHLILSVSVWFESNHIEPFQCSLPWRGAVYSPDARD